MAQRRRIIAKLRSLPANKRAEDDLSREVASHLTLLADDFERRGMSCEEARLAARRTYGGVEQAKQAHRDERSLLWMERAMQDLADLESEASAQRRFQTSLLTVFAAIALFLALVGLYGLMACSVSRRTREVGIRMALGAQRSDVLLLVLRKAAVLLALGLLSGLIASWFATRVIQAFLFGVDQHDPVTILSVCALLALSGLIAAIIPARRAASIDPMQALRTE